MMPSPITVALHTLGALMGSGLGVQVIVVVVPRTAARLPLPLLPACVAPSPLYVAVSVWGPATVGVYPTWQVAVVPFTVLRLQAPPANVPLALVDQLTIPVGVLPVPASVSVTVTVHVAAVPTLSGFGVQLTLVLVVRLLTVSVVEPLLPR